MAVSSGKQRRRTSPVQVDVGPDADRVLVDQAAIVLGRHDGDWVIESAGVPWCMVSPVGQPIPEQGWKLHVSATPLSATLVLARSAEVLVRNGCAFKFAASLDAVADLGSPECPRGSGGKFITAYPRDNAHFRAVARELHEATEHLPGPAVLSDRAYRPGSPVYYRYGAFRGVTELGNDGSYRSMLRAPGGGLVADERNAWFEPPVWAGSPLAVGEEPANTTHDAARSVVLGGRFEVRQAIRHSIKGGGPPGGRPRRRRRGGRQGGPATRRGAAGRRGLPRRAPQRGRDARPACPDRLRAPPAGPAHPAGPPVPCRGGDRGQHTPELAARPGRRTRLDDPGGAVFAIPIGPVIEVARRLVSLLRAVHERGVVLRDLSPVQRHADR